MLRKINNDGDKTTFTKRSRQIRLIVQKMADIILHFGKCKCLHTGHGKLDAIYKMGDTVLGTTVKLFRRNITYKEKG